MICDYEPESTTSYSRLYCLLTIMLLTTHFLPFHEKLMQRWILARRHPPTSHLLTSSISMKIDAEVDVGPPTPADLPPTRIERAHGGLFGRSWPLLERSGAPQESAKSPKRAGQGPKTASKSRQIARESLSRGPIKPETCAKTLWRPPREARWSR